MQWGVQAATMQAGSGSTDADSLAETFIVGCVKRRA